jgi:hypothetical protein
MQPNVSDILFIFKTEKSNRIFCLASVLEVVVLYGCETWSLTLRESID